MAEHPRPTHRVDRDGAAMPLWVRPGAGGAALVVFPSVFGVGADLVGTLDELATSASMVVAVDLFWREAVPGALPYDAMAEVMARIGRLDRALALDDARAAIAWAARTSGAPVVALGVCFGGPFVLLAAADGLLAGGITWHGTRLDAFVDRAPDVRCPLALHFGARDRVVPAEAVQRVRDAFAGRADVSVVVHPGADHGYSHPGAPTWDPAAMAASVSAAHGLLRGIAG